MAILQSFVKGMRADFTPYEIEKIAGAKADFSLDRYMMSAGFMILKRKSRDSGMRF
jgi:hypothetical protein